MGGVYGQKDFVVDNGWFFPRNRRVMGASSAGANAEKASRDASGSTIAVAHPESDAEWKSDAGAFANSVAESITQ